jgi:hypothetical protein
MTDSQDSFQQRFRRTMLEYAFFRWESAVVIALTLLLTATSFTYKNTGIIPHWTWIACLLFGVISEILLIYASLTDPETTHFVTEQIHTDDFRPKRLRSKILQQKVDKAFDYHNRIEIAIEKAHSSAIQHNLAETSQQVRAWLKNIYILAQRLDNYESEQVVLSKDKKQVSERIYELRKQQTLEKSESVQKQMRETIEGMVQQLQMIERLENTMAQANLKMEHTLSALGTLYSQTMLIRAKDVDAGYAKRLQNDISEETNTLNAILVAMDEVYKWNSVN